jgi:hypothetical protein
MTEDAKALGKAMATDAELDRDGRYGSHVLLWTLVVLVLMGVAALWWPSHP